MVDKTTKWREYVAISRTKRRSWRAAKAALVAIRRVGVGPGVKMEFQSSSRNEAMVLMVMSTLVHCGSRCQKQRVRFLPRAGGDGEPPSFRLRRWDGALIGRWEDSVRGQVYLSCRARPIWKSEGRNAKVAWNTGARMTPT